jgi:hypothetical protein
MLMSGQHVAFVGIIAMFWGINNNKHPLTSYVKVPRYIDHIKSNPSLWALRQCTLVS